MDGITWFKKRGRNIERPVTEPVLNLKALSLFYFYMIFEIFGNVLENEIDINGEHIITMSKKFNLDRFHKLKYLDNNPIFGSNKNAAPTIRPV
ncbi:hypothetical protein BpHYR1_049956 [Brachionus plicatilis]|uniref:Uncharacterized protein n=1 Tax=Brachionus plicatilis TaxID=10195 RepID=A0A3M7P9Z6_BRAPC|nr:hypothetical protein BpHYR1_049956 [Brachionus plicatilis]